MFEKGSSYRNQSAGSHRSPTGNDGRTTDRSHLQIQPRRGANLNYSPDKSNVGTHPNEIQLYPIEIRPLLKNDIIRNNKIKSAYKKNDSSAEIICSYPVECNNRVRIPRKPRQNYNNEDSKSRCAPDVYRNILGPTPDESILAGLQTVIDLCGLIDSRNEDDSEYTPASADSSTLKCPPTCPKKTTFDLDRDSYHRLPSRHKIVNSRPNLPNSPMLSPIPYARTFDSGALATSSKESLATVSYDSVQGDTYRTPLNVRPKSEMSAEEQDYKRAADDSNNNSVSYSPNDLSDGLDVSESMPCVKVTVKDHDAFVKYKCKSATSTLSPKCFPTVEIPPCEILCSKCYSVGFSVVGDQLPNGGSDFKSDKDKPADKSSKSVVIQDPKAKGSMYFDPKFTCNKDYKFPKDRKPKNYRCSHSMLPPVVQPVTGVCTDGKCGGGERLLDLRYALVKISVFQNYTTYEIMKSTQKKPKKMSDCVEGIFVTKR